MNYKIINTEDYYRKDIFKHFTNDIACATSITNDLDVTALVEYSKKTNTKLYVNFLYCLSKALNSKEDYRYYYDYTNKELRLYDVINPIQYIFHEETSTFTVVYSKFDSDYEVFYQNALKDIEDGKKRKEYGLAPLNHPNWFDASFIPWISFSSLNIELPNGYIFLAPIVNWGKYYNDNGIYKMPVSIRMHHAIADGYHISIAFKLIENEINCLVNEQK